MRLALAAVLLTAQSMLAHADVTASSAVDSVTVFLSGAEITRVTRVKLDKGEQTVIISDVPASAVPGSIRVEGKATGKLEIGSVDSSRKLLQRVDSQAADVQRKSIEDQIEKLKDERSGVEAQALAAKTQKTLIGNLAELPSRPPVASGSAAPPAPEDWTKILSLIGDASINAGKLGLDAQQKLRDIDRKIKDLKNQLASLAPPKTEQTEVVVHVVAQSSLDADLTIRYQVPDAFWTPIYDARLNSGTKTEPPAINLARRAAITQRSGEDWTGVNLELSTARPSEGAAAPTIDTQFVTYEPEPMPVAAAAPPVMAKRAMAPASEVAADQPDKVALENAPEPQDAGEARAAIETAPFEATFAVPGKVSVKGNGETKRVLLTAEDIQPTLSARTVPKMDANAYLYANIKIAKGTPLLPGKIYLFRDGTFVGTGDMPLLPPGESHDLGFGVDDQVKVKHIVLEEKRGEAGLISTSHVDSRNFRVTIKNLHERPIDVRVLDRVPVSQNDEIKVEYTGHATPTTQAFDDKRGVIAFDAHLEPDEEKALEYGYRVSWPSSKSIVYGP